MEDEKRNPLFHEGIDFVNKVAKQLGIDLGSEADRAKLFAEIEKNIQNTAKNPIYVYGKRTQNIFFEMVKAIGSVKLIKEEDSGAFATVEKEAKLPDYRIITSEDESFLVEVKNFYYKRLPEKGLPFRRIRKKDFQAYSVYAGLLGLPIKYAIYWQNIEVWTLTDSSFFIDSGSTYTIEFGQAMLRNEMIKVGDYSIATVSPLRIRVDFEPAPYDQKKGRQKIKMTIKRIRFFSKDKEIHDTKMQKLAFILMMYAGWNIKEPELLIKENKIIGEEFTATPQVDEDYKNWPDLKVYVSTLFTNMYKFEIESKRSYQIYLHKSLPNLENLVPEKPFNKGLPLWIFRVHPKED